MSLESPWLFWRTDPAPADRNMACDEALLETVGKVHRPVLRVYGWDPPAASFGYSQRYDEVCAMTRLRPLVRRPTGGGLVPHDLDWTYSLSVPPGHWWYALSAVDSYRTIHEWIAAAFSRMGIETALSACCRHEMPGQCFSGAER